jgi:hypothetical protein
VTPTYYKAKPYKTQQKAYKLVKNISNQPAYATAGYKVCNMLANYGWSKVAGEAWHSGTTPSNIFFLDFFYYYISISNVTLIAKCWNFGSNFQKLVHGKVLWPKTFFQFFPDFICDFALFRP